MPITAAMIKQTMQETEAGQLYEVFTLFSNYAKQHRENHLEIIFSPSGAGSIKQSYDPGCNEWLAWNDLDEAPGKLRAAIAQWEKQEAEEYGEYIPDDLERIERQEHP